MSNEFLLYHWSPKERRERIKHSGLVPKSWSTDRLWRPPFICFADSPSLGWILSGGTERGLANKEWDLWAMWSSVPSGYEVLPVDGNGAVEYRVYERIYKRDIWYVATRESRFRR